MHLDQLPPDFGVPSQELTCGFARATDELRLVGLVAAEARRTWRAAAWLPERRYSDRWAPIRRRPDGELEPVAVDDDPFAEVDELRRRRERLPRD
jgi:hypothetical protein